MATEHGAATTPFGNRIGRLAPGCLADVVLLDWSAVTRPWQDPAISLVDVLVRRARAGAVETTIVGGEVIYHQGQFVRVDRDEVHAALTKALDRPDTPAEAARRSLARTALTTVQSYYADWEYEQLGQPE